MWLRYLASYIARGTAARAGAKTVTVTTLSIISNLTVTVSVHNPLILTRQEIRQNNTVLEGELAAINTTTTAGSLDTTGSYQDSNSCRGTGIVIHRESNDKLTGEPLRRSYSIRAELLSNIGNS
jgi:hypothetical protein